MTEYKEQGKTQLELRVNAEAVYSEATFKRIVEDAVWLHQQAMRNQIDDGQKRRYGRIIVLLMAFYLESLSNLLFEEVVGEELSRVDCRTDLSQPLRKFRAIHSKLLGKELPINVDGIQDVFTIRNKVIAHPSGRARLRSTEHGWDRIDTQVSYRKFKRFPSIYSRFTLQEAEAVLNEVREFMTRFLGLIKDRVPEERIKEWWPDELARWSESDSKQ